MRNNFDETETRTEIELLAAARSGDNEAFGELLRKHYPSCISLATFILRDRSEAQDEVQQACWKAFERLYQYEGEAKFSTWLLRIVVNQCLMLIRGRKRPQFLHLDGYPGADDSAPLQLPSASPDPEQALLKREMIQVLKREIRNIPPLLRSVILLRDIKELSMQEVAERLGITVPAAKSRLMRARIELRKRVLQCCGKSKHMMPLSSEQTLPARSNHRLVWVARA
jgi:RNA polymerase sigma-70 factor, ECF subfamily